MALIQQTATNGDSSVIFTIDDTVPEVVSVRVITGLGSVTITLIKDDGTDGFSVTIQPDSDMTRNLNAAQRRRAQVVERPRGDGTSKFVLSFPHRIEFNTP